MNNTGIVDLENAWQTWKPSKAEPWNQARAAHLVRRGGFGASMEQLEHFEEIGFEKTLDAIFSREGTEAYDQELKPLERTLVSSQDPQGISAWWLLRMLQSPCQLLEKATLFWHGHFATGAEKVANSRAMLQQSRLLREHALGKFEPMVQGISRDVAMLIYLDSEDNRKTRPNENYARELMELFCLGPGNYTEDDIKQLARCFTGWQIHRGSFRFNPYQHDEGEKSFLGRTGKFGGEEAVRIVLEQPATAEFLAGKLLRFYIADDLPLQPELLAPLAKQLRDSDFDLGATIRMVLSSRVMFSSQALGHKVRSPVEMSIGLLRTLGAKADMNKLRGRLFALGHLPMYPPNVKGWEGGRQWINASTYFGRANLVEDIVSQKDTAFEAGSVSKAIGAKANQPEKWLRHLVDVTLSVPLPDKTMAQLLKLANAKGNDLDRKVSNVLTALGATPEYQLM